jgi:hypothetical protein
MSSYGALTPSYLVDFETRFELIRSQEYKRLSASENLWYKSLTTERVSQSKRDVLPLLFESAQIKPLNGSGEMRFEQIGVHYTEIETEYAGTGFKISRDQLEDVHNGVYGGEALDLSAEWSAQTAEQMVYWPQKLVAEFLKNAHDASFATGYDDVAFFSASHPVHPLDASKGTYSNLLTGSGTYAIHEGIADATALANLAKVRAHIRKFKMPNGEDPRFLKPVGILCNSTMYPRVAQLLDSKFISKDSGSTDIAGYVSRLGFGTVMEAPELNDFESDTTYFVICETSRAGSFGGVIHTVRRPFEVQNYGPQSESDLGRRQEFEWHCRGKDSVRPGHPFTVIKVKAT